jgi:hypothetical protein
MARRFQHPHQQAADLDDVAMAGAQVDIGDFGRLVVRGDDATVEFLLQLGDAADMVAMVMGDQDVRQRPAFTLQRLDNGGGFRRIDRSGGLGRGIVDQIAKIVVEAGESTNFRGHDSSMSKALRPIEYQEIWR